jgi:DmsE family decaheme c-type cytochrome
MPAPGPLKAEAFPDATQARVAWVAVTAAAQDATAAAASAPKSQGTAPGDDSQPAACEACHGGIVAGYSSNAHGMLGHGHNPAADQGCSSCHGGMAAHLAADGGVENIVNRFVKKAGVSAAGMNATCLRCHDNGACEHWLGSPHEEKGLACVDCHSMHAGNGHFLTKKTIADTCMACHVKERGDFNKMSHHPVIEGRMTCTDCHQPHGTSTDKLLSAATVNDGCYGCHAEKRGPVLFEHPPVAENCLNCHSPHGSIHAGLLKNKAPFLCQACHSSSGHPSGLMTNSGNGAVVSLYVPGATGARFGTAAFNSQGSLPAQYRGCLNCHAMIHGSNDPAGASLSR